VVRGYYAIAAGSVTFEQFPSKQRKRLPKYPIPVALLGRLAVDSQFQGRGLGKLLLLDALAKILRTSDSIGIHAVEVKAIDEAAKQFYLKYGFVELTDDQRHLYLPISTIRRLDLPEPMS